MARRIGGMNLMLFYLAGALLMTALGLAAAVGPARQIALAHEVSPLARL